MGSVKGPEGGLSGSYMRREAGECSQFFSQVLAKKSYKDNLITGASHLCSNDTVFEKKCAHNRVVDDESIAEL